MGKVSDIDPQQIGRQIGRDRQALAEQIIDCQYALRDEYGAANRDKSVRDAGYHLAYLSEAIAAADPTLFVDYMAWAQVLFHSLGFSAHMLGDTLHCTGRVLQAALPADAWAQVEPYIRAGQEQAGHAAASPPSFLAAQAPWSALARGYLDALLGGERHQAGTLILDAAAQGTPVKDIYLHVFQPAQREIGRLWQTNQISVAQEHYCTAATQLIMSQLYPRIFRTAKTGRRLVATCVGGELHELGVRMVADLFELEGWDTCYLGANTPAAGVIDMIERRQAHVLAVSATMTFHVTAVAELIAQVRASPAGQEVVVLVGGYPFNLAPDLWRRVRADGYAPDAQEALAIAARLVDKEPGP